MLINEVFDWLFPMKCLICGCEISQNSILCSHCFSKITFIDYPFCTICGKILESSYGLSSSSDFICETCLAYPRNFDEARALFQYDEISKSIIMRIKKHSDSFVAKSCASMIFFRYKYIFAQADYVVPVPSHWSRFLKRGFNPADIIATEFSRIAHLPVCKILKRIKKTEYQKGKSISERFSNVADAFSCSEYIKLSGKKIVLVDDVMTTGATLNECAKALRAKKCSNIFCLTISTTPIYKKYL